MSELKPCPRRGVLPFKTKPCPAECRNVYCANYHYRLASKALEEYMARNRRATDGD